jgi:hypothetical protein
MLSRAQSASRRTAHCFRSAGQFVISVSGSVMDWGGTVFLTVSVRRTGAGTWGGPDIEVGVRFGIAPHVGDVAAIRGNGKRNGDYAGRLQQLLLAARAIGVLTVERLPGSASPIAEDNRFSVGPPDGPIAVLRGKSEACLGTTGDQLSDLNRHLLSNRPAGRRNAAQ